METFEVRYPVAADEHLVFDGKSWFILWQGTRLNLEDHEAVAMALPSVGRSHTVADLLVRIALSKARFVRVACAGAQLPPRSYEGSTFARHLRLKALAAGVHVLDPVRALLDRIQREGGLGAEYQVEQPDGPVLSLTDWIGREFIRS